MDLQLTAMDPNHRHFPERQTRRTSSPFQNSHERQTIRSKTEAPSSVYTLNIRSTGVQAKVFARRESRLTDFGSVLERQAKCQRESYE